MTDSLINLKNTYHAAMVMVDMDISLVKENYFKDYYLFIADLKKALDEYEKPFTLNRMNSHETQLDKYLSDLLKASQNIYNILNDDGKKCVEDYLTMGKK